MKKIPKSKVRKKKREKDSNELCRTSSISIAKINQLSCFILRTWRRRRRRRRKRRRRETNQQEIDSSVTGGGGEEGRESGGEEGREKEKGG